MITLVGAINAVWSMLGDAPSNVSKVIGSF
jgi:hypothetical protein